jgi:hypothetical protein
LVNNKTPFYKSSSPTPTLLKKLAKKKAKAEALAQISYMSVNHADEELIVYTKEVYHRKINIYKLMKQILKQINNIMTKKKRTLNFNRFVTANTYYHSKVVTMCLNQIIYYLILMK